MRFVLLQLLISLNMDYFLLITYFISFIPQFHGKTIEDKIQILPFGSPIWMLENEPFEVACEITRSEETTSPIVDISKDGFPIEHHTGYTVTKTESVKQDKIVLRHTVTKDSTSITDEGRYSCQAGRFDDFKIIKVFSVYVQDTNITHGEDAIIKCDPEPHLEQLEVIWYKFNQPLESVPGLYPRIHLTDHNHTLTIKQAKYLKLTSRHLKTQTQIILDTNGIEDSNFDAAVDAGEYRCDIIFYHGFKRLEQTFTKTAKMYGKPKIIDSGTSSRKFTVMKNETLRLVCSVTGYPSPDVVWLKNGEIVREQNIASSKRAPFLITYTIRNLSKSDAGEYACSFENMMGRAIKTIQVDITGLGVNSGHCVTYFSMFFLCILTFVLNVFS